MNFLATSELPPHPAHVDEFPSAAADDDYAIQVRIAIDMESARGLQTAFETNPQHSSSVWRMRNRLTPKSLYPNLTKVEARGWLMPLIRRLLWNAAKPG